MARTDPAVQRALALRHGVAPGVGGLATAANTLWCLGALAQAVRRSQEALALAQALAHPYSLAYAQNWAAVLHHRRREVPAVQAQADALLALATAQGFSVYAGMGIYWRGWALAMQGQGAAGLDADAPGLELSLLRADVDTAALSAPARRSHGARRSGRGGAPPPGGGPDSVRNQWAGGPAGGGVSAPGEFLLRQTIPEAAQAEACFQQALAIARRQEAKSWELRAAMSLAACGSTRTSGTTPAHSWPPSTAGSRRALTPPTCRRPRRCWRNWL